MSSKASSKPKSKIQTPKSKRRRLGPPQKERILNWSKIQNPKSKLQTPNSKIQNPKSKIQDPKSKIQNPKSKIQNPNSKLQTPNSKLQNPNSKIQNPNGPFGVWILDFGLGRAGNGGDGYVANDDAWPCWPPEFGLVGGALACSRKVAGSIPPARGPNWAPISGGGVLPEIEPRFPAPRRGDRSPISGETAGQAGADITLCVSARDVNITRHRPCGLSYESLWSLLVLHWERVNSMCFPQKTSPFWDAIRQNLRERATAPRRQTHILAKIQWAIITREKKTSKPSKYTYIYPELQWTQIFVLTDKFRTLIPFMFWPSTSLATHPFADFGVPSISVHFPLIHNPWSSATLLPGRRLTGASLFKYICIYNYICIYYCWLYHNV